MGGSVAEERIRAKAEAWLQDLCPEGRIIHELVMAQGGSRIDIAVVAPNRIIAVEIKSERDVLTRLPHQLEAAAKVVDHLFVAASPCKVAKLLEMHRQHLPGMVEVACERGRRWEYQLNPKYVGPWPRSVRMLRETDDGFETVTDGVFGYPEDTMFPNVARSPWDRL